MNINYKQPQFELFPSNATHIDDTDKPKYLLANVTLSIENLVILLILCILLTVLAYALGVEQGKRVAAFDQSSKVSSRVAITQSPKTGTIAAPAPTQGQGIAKPTVGTLNAKGVVQRGQVTAVAAPAVASASAMPVANAAPVGINSVGLKPYTIQVASYKAARFAEREASVLKARGWETQIIQKGSYVILCVGRFTTRTEADDFARRLRPTYKDYVVRRL